jgi:hypothetical protein
MTWLLAIVLKPFALLVLFVIIILPIERFASKHLPDGRLKQILFFSWEV